MPHSTNRFIEILTGLKSQRFTEKKVVKFTVYTMLSANRYLNLIFDTITIIFYTEMANTEFIFQDYFDFKIGISCRTNKHKYRD